MPPLLIVSGDTPYLGLLVSKLKFDLSTERSPGEALARGFDEAWRGVYFEELAILGMDRLFPDAAEVVGRSRTPPTAGSSSSRTGSSAPTACRAISGWRSFPAPPLEETPAERDAVFRGLAIEIEFDRGNIIKLRRGSHAAAAQDDRDAGEPRRAEATTPSAFPRAAIPMAACC